MVDAKTIDESLVILESMDGAFDRAETSRRQTALPDLASAISRVVPSSTTEGARDVSLKAIRAFCDRGANSADAFVVTTGAVVDVSGAGRAGRAGGAGSAGDAISGVGAVVLLTAPSAEADLLPAALSLVG